MNGENCRDILIGSLCAIGCEMLFGLSYIFTKQVTDHISPFSLLGWRFLVSALLMGFCAALGIVKIDLKGKPVKPLLRVAIFCPACYFIGETIGINYTSASESGVFLSCIPVISLLTSSLILRKKPEVRQAGRNPDNFDGRYRDHTCGRSYVKFLSPWLRDVIRRGGFICALQRIR